MHPFEELLYKKIQDSVASWPIPLRKEVYAAALCYWEFYVSHPEVAPIGERSKERVFQNVFSLLYNTRANVRQTLEQDDCLQPFEAEWMLHGWLPDNDAAEVKVPNGAVELPLYHSWCDAMNVERKSDIDDYGNPIHEEESLAGASVAACRRVVEKLHENRILSIPIIIFNIHDGPEIKASKEANPPELLTEFNAFCRDEFIDDGES